MKRIILDLETADVTLESDREEQIWATQVVCEGDCLDELLVKGVVNFEYDSYSCGIGDLRDRDVRFIEQMVSEEYEYKYGGEDE